MVMGNRKLGSVRTNVDLSIVQSISSSVGEHHAPLSKDERKLKKFASPASWERTSRETVMGKLGTDGRSRITSTTISPSLSDTE